MRLRLLGAAAGGGFPQWNCACSLCEQARRPGGAARPRLQASLGVSADGRGWHIINATPDIRYQIEAYPELHPGPGVRETPIGAVLLTDAELDHTIGLLDLREASSLRVFASPAVVAALRESIGLDRILDSYSSLEWVPVIPGEAFTLAGGRLSIRAFPVGTKKPRYASTVNGHDHWVIGYRLQDLKTGGTAAYAPGVATWTPELDSHLSGADCIFVDGTFWADEEMIRLGLSNRTAREMGHLPMSGDDGSAAHLSATSARHRVYVHVNNTNPVLDERSPQYRVLSEQGIEVGSDGMEFEI